MTISGHVLGEKFLVDGPAGLVRGAPRLLELNGGRILIVYSSIASADSDQNGISGQIVSSTGQDIGGEFLLNAGTADIQTLVSLTPLGGGGFIALWDTNDVSTRTTIAQLFDDTGARVGGEITLRTGGSGTYWAVDLVQLANGNIMLVTHENQPGGSVTGHEYDLNGTAIGAAIDLDGNASLGSSDGEITPRGDGGFALSWRSINANNDSDSYLRLFNSNGTPQGGVISLTPDAPGGQGAPEIAFFADGSFVAVWVSSLNGRQDIRAQLFDANGVKVGTEFLVNVTDNTYNDYPAVAVLADQTFVVTWQRPSYYYNAQSFVVNRGYGTTAQVFTSDGTAVGAQFWIDETGGNRYTGPSIEALDNGGYIVSWHDQKVDTADPDTNGLRARIFGPNSLPEMASPNQASVVENTIAVTPLIGHDADVNARLTYAISGGPDAAFFAVNAQTGALRFVAAPDFEGTAFHSNTYSVQVSVSDGYATAFQTLTIYVTDAREAVNLTGTEMPDTLVGTEFADTLSGLGGDDTLIGGDDADFLDGGAGTDLLYGGGGNDTYAASDADLIFESAGEGNFDCVFADSSFYLFANIESLFLNAAAGNAFGVGNDLDNILIGNSGENLLIGMDGADSILGGDGNDTLFGMDGADTLFGEGGIDYLAGGAGDDTLYGYTEADALHGEGGNDILWAGEGFVTDILTGGDGDDELHGDSGEADFDLMNGGSGNDTFWVDTGDDLTFEAIGGGIDTVIAVIGGTNNGVYLYANVENLVLEGTTAFGVGNELANQLLGNAQDNWLLGGAGDDVLTGGEGNDVLFGEAGADCFVLDPGSGADLIADFQVGTDTIDLAAFGYDWAGVQAAMGQVDDDTFINLANGDLVVLSGVSMDQLTAASFIF